MFRVMGAVDVKHTSGHELTLEWNSSASNDMIADSVMAVIVGIERSPASVKLSSTNHDHTHHSHHGASYDQPHPHADLPGDDSIVEKRALRTQKIADFLQIHFGEVETIETRPDEDGKVVVDPAMIVHLDEWEARIGLLDLVVTSSSLALKARVESVLEMAMTTVDSLATSFHAIRESQNAVTLGGVDKIIGNGSTSLLEIEGQLEGTTLNVPQNEEAADSEMANGTQDIPMDGENVGPKRESEPPS